MLILSRRCGESFIIGDDIKVTVLASKGNQIRLGIDAPRSLPVHREEIFLRLQQNKEKEEKEKEKEASAGDGRQTGNVLELVED